MRITISNHPEMRQYRCKTTTCKCTSRGRGPPGHVRQYYCHEHTPRIRVSILPKPPPPPQVSGASISEIPQTWLQDRDNTFADIRLQSAWLGVVALRGQVRQFYCNQHSPRTPLQLILPRPPPSPQVAGANVSEIPQTRLQDRDNAFAETIGLQKAFLGVVVKTLWKCLKKSSKSSKIIVRFFLKSTRKAI
jgi:hypothetical protein